MSRWAYIPMIHCTSETVPGLFAQLLTCLLAGILIVQVYLYYIAFPLDHWRVKTVVALSCLLEAAQLAIACYDAYRVFGYGWGIADELDKIGLLWFDVALCTGLAALLCQFFYAWRIFALSGKKYFIPVIVVILSICQMGLSVFDAAMILKLQHLSLINESVLGPVGNVWLGLMALCDIIITCSIFFYLWKAKKLNMNGRTNTILSRLMRLTIETGFLTSTFSILALILSTVQPENLLYTLFMGPTSKLYANSLLAVLNSRIHIAGSRDQGEDTDVGMSVMNNSPHGASIKFAPNVNLHVSKATSKSGGPMSAFSSGIVVDTSRVEYGDGTTIYSSQNVSETNSEKDKVAVI
ncbi:hypothetical protein BXZ70DRAFT_1012875 [Cristinia sonorae]|uniref:DUF6534 domain-containing protein n=1 Tax=Cristinia sonorae TaxID=1940300 RepID=A0A8K0UEM5_9AGAR|nr:hypothetical protein BXZ70DRAFT_1012875 [Cristinia sonorae]